MQPLAKAAFVATTLCALFCIAAYIAFAVYLATHRPTSPAGIFCWPMSANGVVFLTWGDTIVRTALRYAAFIAAAAAVALDLALRSRR
jgi:hypothetical protein